MLKRSMKWSDTAFIGGGAAGTPHPDNRNGSLKKIDSDEQ
jgi:hypothetical protein